MHEARVLAAAVHWKRIVTLSFTAALLTSSAALADTPGVPDVALPSSITLVGHVSGSPDAGGRFEILVRDHALQPIAGSIVVLDFGNVADLHLSTAVVQPGSIVDCPTRTIRSVTDANGRASFTIVGAALVGQPQCLAATCPGKVRVYTDGIYVGEIDVSAFDLDGVGGVSGADLAAWLGDFGSALDPRRSDYDGNGNLGGADLSLWLTRFGSELSQQSGGTYCP